MAEEQILLVDDEPGIHALLNDVLREEGYRLSSAYNGKVALELLEKQQFSLAMVDLRMPEMGGLSFIKRCKEIDPEMMVIIMTGYASLETAQEAIQLGAFDYITKPFDLAELKRALSKAFDRLELERENAKLKGIVGLFKVSDVIGSTVNIDKVLEHILATALSQTRSHRGSIMLVDASEKRLVLAAGIGLSKTATASSKKVYEGIAGRVVREGKALFVTNIRDHPMLEKLSRNYADKAFISVPLVIEEELAGTGGELFFPLKTRKKVVGVMNISDKEGDVFSESDFKILSILASQAAVSINNAQLLIDNQKAYVGTLQSLALILEARDAYTRGHSMAVTRLSLCIGKEMKLGTSKLQVIKYGGDLHDIGKIAVADSILNKKGPLTDDEWAMIKKHPIIGDNILKPITFLKEARDVIRHHHERFDGSGYPDGIHGDELSLTARIVAVADSYAAMISARPYREACTNEHAISELEAHAGTQFDPVVVEVVLQIARKQKGLSDSVPGLVPVRRL